MEPETITHSTDGYQFTATLEDGTLLLQLKSRGSGNREIVAQNIYVYDDMPEKIKAFGGMREVH